MIRLVRVSKNYVVPTSSGIKTEQVVPALREISLEIPKGEFIALMGPSGCGKSTMLHIVGGLDTPTEGEVWFQEKALHQFGERELSLFRRESVGIVFQFFNLLPHLTCSENVCLPLRLLGVSVRESEARTSSILSEVGLGEKLNRLPAELSGGEQQRVAIARALIHRPKLVLADEPTGNLDSATSASVLKVLRDLHLAHGTTLVLVTHSEEVARVANRTIRMQDGRLVA
jgi:ABC-type lipoprotein export system ATPase subunit